jgi:cell wall-associated NlpC family hydrolase
MSTEADQRAAVVAEARSWIGTPWHHEACVKGAGVDCAMLLAACYKAAGLVDLAFDPRPYHRDWMFHRKEEKLLGHVLALGAREIWPDQAGPADIVLWKIGHTLSHVGIVSAWPWVIHAYAKARQVQEDDITLQGPMTDPNYPRRFFSFWATPERLLP